jgi:hypothetical protein
VAATWHSCGMARLRVSTTVDGELLASARAMRKWGNDASMLDAALTALIAVNRSTEIDAKYRAYEAHPLDERDAWGDLDSFRTAAGAS